MITDVVQANVGNGFVDVASIAVDTSKKPVLAAGEEFSYPFTVYFKQIEGATYQNIERVSISNLIDRTGQSMAAEAVMSVKATSDALAGERTGCQRYLDRRLDRPLWMGDITCHRWAVDPYG